MTAAVEAPERIGGAAVTECVSCGHPASHAKRNRPPGVRRIYGQGKCSACWMRDSKAGANPDQPTLLRVENGVRIYACLGCGRACAHRRVGCPEGVVMISAKGRCGACYLDATRTGDVERRANPQTAARGPADLVVGGVELRECLGCQRLCAPRNSPVPGYPRHAGHGLCDACYQTARRPETGRTRRVVARRVGIAGPAWEVMEALRGAACKGEDTELFVADADDDKYGRSVPDRAVIAARRWCAHCPVLVECQTFADRYREVGLWGAEWRTVSGTVRPIRTKTAGGAA